MSEVEKELDEARERIALLQDIRDNISEDAAQWQKRATAAETRLKEVEKELDEARALVIEANNSLYGSQNYFHYLDGGPFDKHHLASGIERLKEQSRKDWSRATAAEARAAEMAGALSRLVAMGKSIANDLSSAHSARGNAASEWMREDDRDLRIAFDKLRAEAAALASEGETL